MLNEPQGGGGGGGGGGVGLPPVGGDEEGTGGNLGGGGLGGNPLNQGGYIQVTPDERAAIDRVSKQSS